MRIDHLVWYAADLAAGEKHFTGWDAAPAFGGAHPGQGTRNSVLSLGDSTYVEILARDPAQTGGTLDREIAALKGQGLYHWAVGGIDLGELAARARQAGVDASAVVSGGRHLPDGNWLSWSLVGIRRHGFGALVPFFIDFRGNHPAATAPRGGSFKGIELFSPRAQQLGDLFGKLGLEIPISQRDKPGITATVETAGGTQKLESFDPMPRGFVI